MNAAIRFPLTVIMILAAGTVRADDAANKSELDKLKGKWKLVSAVDHGQEEENLSGKTTGTGVGTGVVTDAQGARRARL